MGWYDWLLFLHVLGAFAVIGGISAFWALTVASRPARPLLPQALVGRLAPPTTILLGAGMMTTLVFGIWLAIYVDGYELWDGWILASLVLWLVSGGAGDRSGRAFTRAAEGGATAEADRRLGLVLFSISTAAALAILLLMIFKPGA